jgi:hypothetical protein
MAFKHLPFGIRTHYWKTAILLALLILPGIRFSLFAQGGLKSIIVDKIPVSTEAQQNDPQIPVNSFSYRIFVEMDSSYELQAVFSLENHAIIIKTSTHFYNNSDFGGTAGKDLLSALFSASPALPFDSYITLNAAANNKLGIVVEEDTTDDKADGFITGTTLPLQTVGEDFSIPFGTENFPGTFKTNMGIFNVIGGVKGPTATNRVLIGQFTTDGDFSFELNIQIRLAGTDYGEQYVARDPQGEEIYFPALTWPSNTPPAVVITNPIDGKKIKTGEPVLIEASATDPDSVTSVKLLLNGNEIGTDTLAPFKFNWIANGDTARFSAIATDGTGLSDTSSVVEVFVGSFAPPTIILSSPEPSDSFLYGQEIPLVAEASDVDGNILKVEFFHNNIKIGEDLTLPYELNWIPETTGNISLFAVATDNDSLETSSDTIEINVSIASGIESPDSPEMMVVYPNPANKNVSLKITGLQASMDYYIEIIGMDGQVYLKTPILSQDVSYMHHLDVSSLSKGIYQLRLIDSNSKSLTRKLIIN